MKKEYEENKKKIKQLKKNSELLNENGVNKYYKLLKRNEEIKEKLERDFPIIAIDFDGVLNKYSGWNGKNDLSVPQSGVKYFLGKLDEEYSIIIFTVRDADKVWEWLEYYELDKYILHITNTKPKARAYIDDRAINYDGNYNKVLKKLNNFKAWWE